MFFALKTLNGRFILVSLGCVVLLLALALYSHKSVHQSASDGVMIIQKSQILTDKLNNLTNTLEEVESKLHQFATFLRSEQQDAVLALLTKLESQAANFRSDVDVQASAKLNSASQQLLAQTDKLSRIIKQYLYIMQNVESRYPGMPILLTYLEPSNRKFSEAVELALQEGELTEFNPRIIQRDHYRIMQLFQEARYAWAMQISWFRVFVANRMGAFGDPETAMRNNLANRAMFANNVAQILQRLENFNQKGMLGLQQGESLGQMREALNLTLLRDSLQPALDEYWQILHMMENGIADINKHGIARSQKTANLLSYFIWVFTGVVCLMFVVAYNIFQKKIRRPVLQLADNMYVADVIAEELPLAQGNVAEIDKLIGAYTEMRQLLDNRQRRLQSILDNAAESIITIDGQGRIESFNKAASQLFGYKPEEVVGTQFSGLLPGQHQAFDSEIIRALLMRSYGNQSVNTEWDLLGQRKDGSQFYLSLKFSEMQIAGQTLYTAIVDDISERRAVLEHLRHLAEHDSLTSLYNRQYFNQEMERAFAQSRRDKGKLCACIYIDLDNFKYINDTLGHLEGDRLLISIANTLKARTRKTDILARLGGDEFALILPNVAEQQAGIVAEDYRNAIANVSFVAGGKHIDTGCSIGVALYEDDIENKEGLLARADIACHMAKRNGRNQIHIFEHDDKSRIDTFYAEMGWTRRIRHALENDDFVFACQPMLSVRDGMIFSYELLLRMRDQETNEYIMPSGFLDSAERFGLMPEIDRWVIEHAFTWLNKQSPSTDNGLRYFINLSGKSIGDNSLLEFIKQATKTLKITPQRIAFEITEDVAIAELEKAKFFLRELRSLGFKTALDDFGVGYSSFSYLRELDVDYVKIDGSFINSMHSDKLNFALVKAINDICHILGKETIAEFVQNKRALKLLKEIGVDYAQGNNIASATDYDQQTIQFRYA
jgi:diguanylate cyclase (GGDEF)-like protein/PAS domain S-box-containing protein